MQPTLAKNFKLGKDYFSRIEIREQKLYKQEFATFEEYCQKRWGWTRMRASQLMEASTVVNEMSTTVEVLPPITSERQARELARVEDIEQRAEAWLSVQRAAN